MKTIKNSPKKNLNKREMEGAECRAHFYLTFFSNE